MKFLHLADLHIGKTVNGFSMLDEQRHVFEQIAGYIQTEKPVAVLIAGDVYDRAVPGVEAVRLFDDFLTTLAREEQTVLLVSGNHDSPERLSYASRLLSDRKLHLCGVFDGALRSVTLQDEYGEANFWLLPFIRPSTVRGFFDGQEPETYTAAVEAVIDRAGIDWTARNVLVSHQFYTGAGLAPIRSESEINLVGGLDAVDAEVLSRFDYAALGHLHGAQCVQCDTVRYTGSPLKYSFSEWRHHKSITLVELGEKGRAAVTPLPLTPIHDMREIRGPIDELTSDEIVSQGDREDYLRVVLTDEDEIIAPMDKLRGKYPNVMALDFENSRTSIDLSAVSINSEKIARLSPYELFCEFFLDVNGSVMTEAQEKIVRELFQTGDEQ